LPWPVGEWRESERAHREWWERGIRRRRWEGRRGGLCQESDQCWRIREVDLIGVVGFGDGIGGVSEWGEIFPSIGNCGSCGGVMGFHVGYPLR